MAPQGHAVISAGIGALVWYLTRSVAGAVTALAVGVFMDADHVLDYLWIWRGRTDQLWVPLHSYELAVPMVIATWLSNWSPLLLAATLAHLGHLVTDQLSNSLSNPLVYFLTYRAWHKFRVRYRRRYCPVLRRRR